MEYIFGNVRRNHREVENVKTVGTEHSDLYGFCHVEKQYPDMIVVDDFRIVEKYQSTETEDACFDWYEIDEHRRYIDKFTPAREEIETGIADSQDAVCMLSEDIEARLAEIEDALCDMSKEDM